MDAINNSISNIKRIDISSFALHIIAMVLMLSDHLWGTILIKYDWLTAIGRLSFPIFAFLIVEGYTHTRNLKKYMLRLFVFAIISEIPFDIMYGSNIIYPYHQNVLWTFLIALIGICLIEKVKKKGHLWLTIPVSCLVVGCAFLLATITMVDYYGPGVLTVFAFYFFRGEKIWQRLGQVLSLYWINCKMLAGLTFIINLFGHEVYFAQQGLAMLSLIFIWMYHGRQGYHNRWIKYSFYAFYPVHALILGLIYTYC